MKEILKLKSKREARFFSLSILILFFLTFLLQLPLLKISVADAQSEKTEYPATPEGVVEAFVRVVFDVIEVEKLARGDVEERMQYYTQKAIALRDHWPGYDCLPIALSYKLIISKVEGNKAIIKVVYENTGDLCCENLEIRKKTKEEVTYHLEKEKGLWKIHSPAESMYISVKTAIRLSEYCMKKYPERKEKIMMNINILKKYLKNSSN